MINSRTDVKLDQRIVYEIFISVFYGITWILVRKQIMNILFYFHFRSILYHLTRYMHVTYEKEMTFQTISIEII